MKRLALTTRTWLTTLAMLVVGMLSLTCPAQADEAQTVLDIADQRQVFIDGRFLAASDGVKLVVHPPRKTGEATVKPDQPWEGRFSPNNNVLKVDGTYHMWYRSAGALCYARSKDGITWEKPILGLAEYEGNRNNNMVLGHGAGGFEEVRSEGVVFYDPTAPADQKFRYAVRISEELADTVVFSSPDGIHWRLTHEKVLTYTDPDGRQQLDSQNMIFWDDRIGKYVAYMRCNLRNPGFRGRSVVRSESKTLTGFQQVQDSPVVIGPDSLNLSHKDIPAVDYYTSAAVKYPWAQDAYYMFPQTYYHYLWGALYEFKDDQPINAGPIHTQFAASRDGICWERFNRRPFVTLGMKGAFDSKCVRVFSGLVDSVDGRELYMYYLGTDRLHGWGRDEKNQRLLTAAGLQPTQDVTVISRLVLRRDGFVSARGDYTGGQFITPVLKFAGKELVLNVDTSATGIVQCELQTPAGVPIEGYTLKDSDRIHTTNEINRVVTWQGNPDVSKLAGTPVKLHITIRDADLYALQFRK